MISRKVWKSLQYPPNGNAVFERTLASYRRLVTVPVRIAGKKKRRGEADDQSPSSMFPVDDASSEVSYAPRKVKVVRSSSSNSTVLKVLAVGGFIWFFCCSGGFFFLAFVPALLMALGTVYGLYTALRISGIIASEREQGMYDLVSLTPPGALGYSWATSMGFLHRNTTYNRIRRWMRIIFIGFTILMWIALSIIMFEIVSARGTEIERGRVMTTIAQQQLTGVWYAMILGAAVYLDFFHSMIAGLLVAMISPTYGRNRFEAQALTVAGFLGLQIATYLATLIFGFWLLPGLYHSLGLSGWLGEIVLAVMVLGLFFAIRETLIRLLWNVLVQRLNTNEAEFDSITRLEPV
jgi:hypothetical protein